MFRWIIASLFFSCSLLMTSCQLLAPYKSPLTPTPSKWKADHTENENWQEPSFDEACKNLNNWWEVFNDPILDELEKQALSHSYTLSAALERVLEARAQAGIDWSYLFPTINFAPSFSRTGSLVQNPLGGLLSGNSLNGLCGTKMQNPCQAAAANAPSIPNVFRFVQTQILIPLTFDYEIDLWGKLHNQYYAGLFNAQATSQAYLSVLLSITADVASHYFQTRGLDAQEKVLRENIVYLEKAVDINSKRYLAGIVSDLDVSRAKLELARSRSDLDDVIRLRGIEENALATTIGVPASLFSLAYDPLSAEPPFIPTGLPSELLCRRPDIGEAERKLAAAYRQIGVAYANFFPSLSINAAIGLESPLASKLLSWQARYWQVGWNILQTVFDAGRNQSNLDYYVATFREAMANYQETVLKAFGDVEDALVNLKEYHKRAEDLDSAVIAAKRTVTLSQERYDRGLVNYLDVVDAERSLIQSEQNAVIVLANRYTSTVSLIRALGGGWCPCCARSKE